MKEQLVLSVEASRRVDLVAIEEYGIGSLVLMENAARGAADVIEGMTTEKGVVSIVCGKGNNGGDGLAIARQLDGRGFEVRVDILASANDLSDDAKANYEIIRRAGLTIRELGDGDVEKTFEEWAKDWKSSELLVDAMLGTGTTGKVREPYATAIGLMNESGVPIIAIDVPSGLDAQTGEAGEVCIRAKTTVTFVSLKTGFLEVSAKEYLGSVRVVNLGLPRRLLIELLHEERDGSRLA